MASDLQIQFGTIKKFFMKKNWKTTLMGFTSIFGGITSIIVKGDIHTGIVAITTGLGLIFSRDFDK